MTFRNPLTVGLALIGAVVHSQEHIYRIGILMQQGIGSQTESLRLSIIIHSTCPSCPSMLTGLHHTGLPFRIHLQDMTSRAPSADDGIVGQQEILLYEPHPHLVQLTGIREDGQHLLRLLQVGLGGRFIIGNVVVTLILDIVHPQEVLQLLNSFLENRDAALDDRPLLFHRLTDLRILCLFPLFGIGTFG